MKKIISGFERPLLLTVHSSALGMVNSSAQRGSSRKFRLIKVPVLGNNASKQEQPGGVSC